VTFLKNSGVDAFAQLGAVLQAALTPSSNPMVPAIFKANSGAFPFGAQSDQASLRLDRRMGDNNNLFFRGNLTRADEANTTFGALRGESNAACRKPWCSAIPKSQRAGASAPVSWRHAGLDPAHPCHWP
jgi:hypothetical protein